MGATANATGWDFRRFWKRYGGAILVLLWSLVIVLFYVLVPSVTRRAITDALHDYRGGEDYSLILAYGGLSITVAAQAYTFVKRIGVPEYIRKLGGAGLWLRIHIILSLVGLAAILIHAGFPFQFRSSSLTAHGYAALATWLLFVTTMSGVFGRYLYRHLPALKRAFSIWKPIHLAVTALFFLFALLHVWVVAL